MKAELRTSIKNYPRHQSLYRWSFNIPRLAWLPMDTLMAVYSDAHLPSLTRIAENDDDSAGGKTSRVRFSALEGETYLIAVDGFAGESGSIKLTITLSETVGPSIRIEQSGNNFLISWSASATGFVVEATNALTAPVDWTELTLSPVVFGNRNVLKLDAASGNAFYRLRIR